ncbi:MAG: CoA transferase [Cellvibrionaceae bacterium]
MTQSSLPLSGVKVLDFSWALVGSLTTKMLADHGAEVVKVESSLRPCLSRIDKQVSVSQRGNFNDKPWFSHFNTSKLSLRLNMKHERVRDILDPLLEWADVVVENFSPGTMEKLNLDYNTIKKTHPDIIMVSGSVFGQTGPYAKNWGVDGTGAALSSRMYMTGWADRDPVTPSVPYGDVVLPYYMAAAVTAAVDHKRRTGRGEYIDASMYEVCAQQMSDALVATQLAEHKNTSSIKNISKRSGNHSPDVLFQGVFPCQRENKTSTTSEKKRWIGISIEDNNNWEQFLTLVPNHNLPNADELLKFNEKQLDDLEKTIAEWTATKTDYPFMELLQNNGIAAGVVQDIEDTFEHDPQLKHRDYLADLEHPYIGKFGHQTPPFTLSRTPSQVKLAPNLGQHTESICKNIIGLTDEQYEKMSNDELFI